MYWEEDYIRVAEKGHGFGHRGEYKYIVLDRQMWMAIHHTNSFEDAIKYFRICRVYWLEQDILSRDCQ